MTREELESEVIARVETQLPSIAARLIDDVAVRDVLGVKAEADLEARLRRAMPADIHAAMLAYTTERRFPDQLPAETGELVRHLAEAGVPARALLQIYFVVLRLALDAIYVSISESSAPADVRADVLRAGTGYLTEFISRMSTLADEAYTEARDRARHRRALSRGRAVRDILASPAPASVTLDYDLGQSHQGLIITGLGAEDVLAPLRTLPEARFLTVRDEDAVWAWTGGRPAELMQLAQRLRSSSSEGVVVGLGRVQDGVDGFRVTHQQALSAHRYARLLGEAVVAYEQVALLAAVDSDRVLATNLVQDELGPILKLGASAERLLDTLDTYLSNGQNATTTAALLAVSARTVSNRLQAIERNLDARIAARAPELHAALRLRQARSKPPRSGS